MNVLLIIIIGFCMGYILGWLIMNIRKCVDGKKEAENNMKKTYGEDWWEIK